MTTNEVIEIFDDLCRTAEKIFNEKEEVQPFIFIIPSDGGKAVAVVPIDKDKEATSQFVQSLCHQTQAIAGIVICEAWMTVFGEGESWDGTPPSKRLNRVEILQALLMMKGKSETRIWKIHRQNGEKSLKFYVPASNAADHWSRFFGDYFRVDA